MYIFRKKISKIYTKNSITSGLFTVEINFSRGSSMQLIFVDILIAIYKTNEKLIAELILSVRTHFLQISSTKFEEFTTL